MQICLNKDYESLEKKNPTEIWLDKPGQDELLFWNVLVFILVSFLLEKNSMIKIQYKLILNHPNIFYHISSQTQLQYIG
jgi:hypothetical protein